MTNHEKQAEEIATIRPRTFTLELSDADVKRLFEKTAADGITPAHLLEGFIGDLLDGTYTHGSDERGLASEYYERCCYDFHRTGGFLEWALRDFRLNEITDALDFLDLTTGELEYYEQHPEDEEGTTEFIQGLKEDKANAEKEIRDIYSDYASGKEDTQTLEDGMAAIRHYLNELKGCMESHEDHNDSK